jgi:3'-5' exoribonuclease
VELAMPDTRRWIKELKPGKDLAESYVVRSKESRQRRGGGTYLALMLGDRTGQVAALVWEDVERLGRLLEVGTVARVRGQVQRYNQRLQVVIRDAEQVPAAEVDDALFVRSSSVDPDLLWQRLNTYIEQVADPHLKQLLFRIFGDPEVSERFKVTPAGRSMHHAYRSGLLEHTVSMTGVAQQLARHYGLDESLVVTGALLHDLGKIWELEISASIEYTDEGRLLGHLTLETLFVDRVIGELPSFPEETRRQLLHLLLAHHGEYAYGSPRRPKTPEAQLIHMVDNLDSKLAGMLEAMAADGDTDEAWTPYSRILERHVYRRRPPTMGADGSGSDTE